MTLALPSPATVFTLNPAIGNTIDPMPSELGGLITAKPNTVVKVNYPASLGFSSIDQGVAGLDNLILSTAGPKVVFGYSEGATVASVWLYKYSNVVGATLPNAAQPPADELTFVLIGNPNRITGFYHSTSPNTSEVYWKTTPTNSQYKVYDIARRGDGWANWKNLSLMQGLLGMYTTHLDYTTVNPDAAGNTVWSNGLTTYITTA